MLDPTDRRPRRAAATESLAPDDEDSWVDEPEPVGARSPLAGQVRSEDPPSGSVSAAIGFVRAHALVVGLVLVGAMLIGGYFLLQARSVPVAQAAPPSVLQTQPPSASQTSRSGTPNPSAEPSTGTSIAVHVLGAVKRPGLVTLATGARVADAVQAAGGLTANADPAELNLAAVLPDGAQVMIGTKGHPRGEVRVGSGGTTSVPTSAPGQSAKVNLNTGSVAELDTLPGVGPVTAQRIIDWRTQHGRFSRVEELQEIEGIGPKSYAQIAPHVTI